MSNFRYLVWFDVFLTNTELSHTCGWDLLSRGEIAVVRSLIKYSTQLYTYSHLNNHIRSSQFYLYEIHFASRFCRTIHKGNSLSNLCRCLALVVTQTLPEVECTDSLRKLKLQVNLQCSKQWFTSCFINPWHVPDKTRLYNIAFGALVPPGVEVDVLHADALGKDLKERFIKVQLQSGDPTSFVEKTTKAETLQESWIVTRSWSWHLHKAK